MCCFQNVLWYISDNKFHEDWSICRIFQHLQAINLATSDAIFLTTPQFVTPFLRLLTLAPIRTPTCQNATQRRQPTDGPSSNAKRASWPKSFRKRSEHKPSFPPSNSKPPLIKPQKKHLEAKRSKASRTDPENFEKNHPLKILFPKLKKKRNCFENERSSTVTTLSFPSWPTRRCP